MLRKILILLSLVLVFASVASAQDRTLSPVAPSKGQWAYALEDSLPLYEAPNAKADVEYVEPPEEWLKVISSVRDDEDNLWCKVKIGKSSGWLAQNGILFKGGPKSKTASDLYSAYEKKMKKANKTPELFASEDPSECKEFLGFNPLGMTETSIQKRLGKPTARYTDYFEPQFTTLAYEFPNKDMTFDVCMENGKVYTIRLNNGRVGTISLN